MHNNSGTLAYAKHVQQSTMGKKILLSMHPRNFAPDKIICTYIHPFM